MYAASLPRNSKIGGIVDGVLLELVTYIVAGFQRGFALLDDERRLVAMAQLLAFQCRQGELVNGTLARYAAVRQSAAREGHFAMSWEGCALQLLRVCNEAAFAVLGSRMRRSWAFIAALAAQLWSTIAREPAGWHK